METDKEIKELAEELEEKGEYKPIESPVKKLFKKKFWTDKQGNELTFKEFTSRWKKGLEGVTPLQQIRSQIWGFRIMILGLLCGIVICLIGITRLWWLLLILIGGLFNTSMQYLGLWQKKNILEQLEILALPTPSEVKPLEKIHNEIESKSNEMVVIE